MLNMLETFMPWATIQNPSKAVLYAQGRMPHTSVAATAGVLKHHPSSLENTPASSRGNCAKSLKQHPPASGNYSEPGTEALQL